MKNERDYKKQIVDALMEDYENVYLDLSDVTFIDSSGISMLIYLVRFLRNSNRFLTLKSVSENVFQVLELGSFDKYFKFI